MSNDEQFGKKYNVQPNPYKGARASVLARFGQQAQTLAGQAGSGDAVSATAKAKAEANARLSKLALGLSRTQADAQERLSNIENQMRDDTLQQRMNIEKARLQQRDSVNVLDDVAGGLQLLQDVHGLSRAISKAGGDETNTLYDQDKYDAAYEAEVGRMMEEDAAVSPDQLPPEMLKQAHQTALEAARPERSIASHAAGTVARVIENVPVIGSAMKSLRRQNVISAEAEKLAQSNIMTKDQADSYMRVTAEQLGRLKDMYGNDYTLPPQIEKLLMERQRLWLEMGFLGMWDFGEAFRAQGYTEFSPPGADPVPGEEPLPFEGR